MNAVSNLVNEPAKDPPLGDTLSVVSRIKEVDLVALGRQHILPPGAGGPNGGPYKMLRTQVLHRMRKLGANSLAIVGSAPDTGKTLTAINLAIAIAADTEHTALLVDLDLRKPSIHRRFGFTVELGIDDCLRKGLPLRDAIVRIRDYDRLAILPARERCEFSSELLSANHTEALIAEMRARYPNRVLIFDLPPVLQADDALAVSRHVQCGLIVVGEGTTRREDLTRTMELLRELPILGSVLNASREPVQTYY